MKHSSALGFFYTFAYILCIVFSFLWIQKLSHQIPIYFILLSSTVLSLLAFNIINFSSIGRIHKIILSDFKQWFIMSLTLAFIWIFSFLAAADSAFLFVTYFFLTNALSAAVYYRLFGKGIAIFIVMLAIIFWEPGHIATTIYSIIAGVLGFIYWLNSVNFSKKHELKPSEVLAIRFYILLIFALIMCWSSAPDLVNINWTWAEIETLLAIALFNQILPNFFSQSGAQKLDVKQFSFIVSFIPFLAFIGNGLFYQEWNVTLCIISLLATLALNFDIVFSRNKESTNR